MTEPASQDVFSSEIPLLTIREVFMYLPPPLQAASGHYAESWNLEKPIMTGSLRIAQADDRCVQKQ